MYPHHVRGAKFFGAERQKRRVTDESISNIANGFCCYRELSYCLLAFSSSSNVWLPTEYFFQSL